jgi:hypothetical protein
LANGRSTDGRGVLRRAWTRQRHGPLQMSGRTWSAIRNTGVDLGSLNRQTGLIVLYQRILLALLRTAFHLSPARIDDTFTIVENTFSSIDLSKSRFIFTLATSGGARAFPKVVSVSDHPIEVTSARPALP